MTVSFVSVLTSSSVYSDIENKENIEPKRSWSFINPYSQSLWFLSRGNQGEEIKEIQKRTKEPSRLRQKAKQLQELSIPTRDKSLPPIPPKLLQDFPTPEISEFRDANSQLVISTEQQYLQDLDLLNAVAVSFASYINERGIPIKSTDVILLSGNLSLMISLSELLVKNLASGHALVQTLNDHFTRLSQVYPSFFALQGRRLEIIDSVKADQRFDDWFASLNGLKIEKLLKVPANRLCALRDTLTTLGLLEECPKLSRLVEIESSLPSPLASPTVILSVPESWRQKNKQKWKEIAKEPFEYQQLAYFQHEFKTIHSMFDTTVRTLDKCLKLQKQSMEFKHNIGLSFVRFSQDLPSSYNRKETQLTPKSLFFKENFISSSYELYLEKLQNQNNSANKLMSRFEYELGPVVEEISIMLDFAEQKLSKMQRAFSKLDKDTKVDKLIKLHKLNGLLKIAIGLITRTYDQHVRSFLEIYQGRAESAERIIEQFVEMRQQNKQAIVSCGDLPFNKSLALTKVVRKLYN
ncbi:hypothetical protein KL938_000189 [Ogataea parapolymorpha]|nr:hypothetical protein KL938_000189 [Ogataea parapolymorpha]